MNPLGSQAFCSECSTDLTQRLADSFVEILDCAAVLSNTGDPRIECSKHRIERVLEHARQLRLMDFVNVTDASAPPSRWTDVIGRGEKCLYVSEGVAHVVEVIAHLYTPTGLKYRLKHDVPGTNFVVDASCLQAINGETRMLRVNLNTGEEEAVWELFVADGSPYRRCLYCTLKTML